jgi:AraC family transcriptional regulator
MGHSSEPPMTVDAELQVPPGIAQLVHFRATGPANNIMHERATYWLDLSLTPRPRNARACYHNHWGPHRFKRLGRIFMVPAGETIKTCGDGGPSQASIICQLNPESLRKWFDDDLHCTDLHLEASLDILDPNIRDVLLRLAQELRQPGFGSAMLVELMVTQLALEVRRHRTQIAETSASGGLAGWRLRLIEERLQEVGTIPTLNELASLCQISVRQLSRGFRASRGCSIGKHVANIQLDHAKRLLTTGQSVKAIAYSLGFSSPASFCYAFRRSTGGTPSLFRQRLAQGLETRS